MRPLTCVICGKCAGDGISILGNAICTECEKTIVNTDINSDRYDEYKDLIKKKIYEDITV
jgi:hypothetical protein